MGTHVLKRAALIGAAFLLAGTSAACSSGGPAESPAEPSKSAGSQIQDPKDASAVDPCALLSPEAAQNAGLDPAGKKAESLLEESPANCKWNAPGDFGTSVTLTPLTDRSIQTYRDGKAQFSDYQELTIAGHPAVRANKGDPAKDGFCRVQVGTKEGQVLEAFSDTDPGSGVDPCGLAQRALEASVSGLPAAK